MKGRKLTTEEIDQMEAKAHKQAGNSRQIMRELYDSLVAAFSVGEYGELTLGEDEKKPTVRKQFTNALKRRNLGVDWRRGKANTLRFQVVDPAVNSAVQ